ncbi:MAG: 30S ribosomal protein S5 [Gammaproteobacteria bacterium]|nr:30S ribosomal protein S5 [Gammaproteobacteria bacterium]
MRDNNRNDESLFEKLVHHRRVRKAVKGGSIISFSSISVVGDQNGRVGFGLGKARDVNASIRKSMEEARRNMYEVDLNGNKLWYAVTERHGASKIFVSPASEGTGLIAGGAMRAVLEAAGIRDALGKCYGSTNPLNVVRATMKALNNMKSPRTVAEKRGLSIEEVVG